jgi:hypothetical protein
MATVDCTIHNMIQTFSHNEYHGAGAGDDGSACGAGACDP